MSELHDGDPLPLVTPPQGGHVSFVGARARNVDPCRVRISALLRSPRTGEIAAQESRDVSLTPQSDGWAVPNPSDIAGMANVPLCPDYGDEPIVDTPYTLEVTVVDARGASMAGSANRSIVPGCLQSDVESSALCRCECAAKYTLGRCANPLDAGP